MQKRVKILRTNQNMSNCVQALPLPETGIKLRTQFGFTAEKCTK